MGIICMLEIPALGRPEQKLRFSSAKQCIQNQPARQKTAPKASRTLKLFSSFFFPYIALIVGTLGSKPRGRGLNGRDALCPICKTSLDSLVTIWVQLIAFSLEEWGRPQRPPVRNIFLRFALLPANFPFTIPDCYPCLLTTWCFFFLEFPLFSGPNYCWSLFAVATAYLSTST